MTTRHGACWNNTLKGDKTMVRFVIQHYIRRPDINGNRYWLARITSTKTKDSLLFETPHNSNTRALVMDLGLEYEELLEVESVEQVTAKRFRAMCKRPNVMPWTTKASEAALCRAILMLELNEEEKAEVHLDELASGRDE